MLAGGAALAILMLRETLGPFEFFSMGGAVATHRVGLWVPGDRREGEWQRKRWQTRLGGRFALERVDTVPAPDSHLDMLLADGVAIDTDGIARLRAFLERGGALGLFGVRSASDSAPHPISELGVRGVVRPSSDDYRWALVREKRGAISAGMPRGGRIILRSARAIHAVETANAEITWAGAPGEQRHYAAVIHRPENLADPSSGRLFWLAVRPDAALDRADTQVAMGDLTRSATAWLAREPFAEVLNASGLGEAATLQLRIKRRGPRRFILAISDTGAQGTPAFEARVYLNRPVRGVDIGLTSVGIGGAGRAPEAHLLPDRHTVDLEIPALDGGESRAYALDLSLDDRVADTSRSFEYRGEHRQ